MKLKTRLGNLAKILFAAGLIYWLVATKKFSFEDLKPFLSWEAFLFGFALVGLNLTILSERLRYLVKSHHVDVPFWTVWKLNLIGVFFNFAMPGGIGGDVIKAYYLQKDAKTSRVHAFSSALMDRALGLYTFVLMAFCALIYETLHVGGSDLLRTLLIWVGLLLFALTVGLLVLSFWHWPSHFAEAPGIKGRLFRFMDSCKHFTRQPKIILNVIGITVIAQAVTVLFFAWGLKVIMGEIISWPTLFFVVPMGFMVMAVPITPAGLGIGQAAFYFLFQQFANIGDQSGPAIITGFQLFQLAWGLVGAVFYMTRSQQLNKMYVANKEPSS